MTRIDRMRRIMIKIGRPRGNPLPELDLRSPSGRPLAY
jgi:hypothetical protein